MPGKATFAEKYRGSGDLYGQAQGLFPSGITHDTRRVDPHPVYVTRAQGSHKWDVDGNRIIDYVMGHGALLLGHCHPAMVAAVQHQVTLGTHYGASHPLEVEWAGWVQRLIPSAERVKFTSSGTEATMMAMRLARAFTGREKIIRFHHNFHGWHDYAVVGFEAPYDVPVSTGVPSGALAAMVALPQGDLAAVEASLRTGDVAAVILEPGGGYQGKIPAPPGWEAGLRELTQKYGALLIFDEVVTGFRVSPGGWQQVLGIRPDLTTLAKILAGGLPGGAVAGRADILALLEMRDPHWNRHQRVRHPGTFNANPLSAAAAVAILPLLADGEPHRIAEDLARQLRTGITEVFRTAGVPGCAHGQRTMFHLLLGVEAAPGQELWQLPAEALFAGPGAAAAGLRRELLRNGVDMLGATGMVSSAHTAADVEETIAAFRVAVAALQAEGVLPG